MKKYLCDIKLWDKVFSNLCIAFLWLSSIYYTYWKVIVQGAFWSEKLTIYDVEESWRLTAVLAVGCLVFCLVLNIIMFVKWLRLRKEAREFTDPDDPNWLPFE